MKPSKSLDGKSRATITVKFRISKSDIAHAVSKLVYHNKTLTKKAVFEEIRNTLHVYGSSLYGEDWENEYRSFVEDDQHLMPWEDIEVWVDVNYPGLD
jgi:hypothetical protein